MNKFIEFLYLKQKNNLVFYDKFTGLLNRNWLEFHKKDIDKEELYLIMIDLNNLKIINDTKGHLEGDEVIASFSLYLKRCFPHDQVIRFGGDEFIILSYSSPVEKLFDMEKENKFNFSFGICQKTKDLSFFQALNKADNHMYCMKDWQKRKAI